MVEKENYDNTWICGIYDNKKNYGIAIHVGKETEVKATYNAMMSGAKSSGLDTNCLKILPYDSLKEYAQKLNLPFNELIEKFLTESFSGDNNLFYNYFHLNY